MTESYISYIKFRTEFFDKYEGTSYRLGQAFFNTFIKVEDTSTDALFHETCQFSAGIMICKIITDLQWDWDNLKQLQEI